MLLCRKTLGCVKLDGHGGSCEKKPVVVERYTPSVDELVEAWVYSTGADPSRHFRYPDEAKRTIAEIRRQAAEEALLGVARIIEQLAEDTEKVFTEHAVAQAGGVALLREYAAEYKKPGADPFTGRTPVFPEGHSTLGNVNVHHINGI